MNGITYIGEVISEGRVLPEWIDANNHMNVAWYVLAFDLAVDTLWEQFGITDAYINAVRGSTFAVECHVTYQDELVLDDPFVVTAQLLAYDDKRIHQFQRLYQANSGALAATAEWMNLHVDLDKRRVSPWPADIRDRIAAFAENQREKSLPAEFGKRMRVKKPAYSLYGGTDADE